MSFVTFLASDCPMKEIDNPCVRLLSVNEALEKGVEIPDFVLDSSTIDRNKPDVVLWAESEESLGEITIKNAEKSWLRHDNGNHPDTSLQYFASLEWRYTVARANALIEYIRKHLRNAQELEIWHTWIGSERIDSEKNTKHSIHADELTADDLGKLLEGRQYDCIAVKNGIKKGCENGYNR
jgi:hypothetical protein